MRSFFFRHSLNRPPHRGLGRYAFDVTGSCLQRAAGNVYHPAPFNGRIYADGQADNQPGSNVDPNVFSDLLPWFLAFCRISRRTARECVSGGTQILSERVQPGDIVFFGGRLSRNLIFIDTILRISQTVILPQVGGCFSLQAHAGQVLQGLGLTCTWSEFSNSRSYSLNLIDAEAGRVHNETEVNPHRMILGTRRAIERPQRQETLLKCFLDGEGFNFIPLANAQASKNKGVRARPGLFTTSFVNACSILSDNVSELDAAHAEALLSLVFQQADTLVLDPPQPTRLPSWAYGNEQANCCQPCSC